MITQIILYAYIVPALITASYGIYIGRTSVFNYNKQEGRSMVKSAIIPFANIVMAIGIILDACFDLVRKVFGEWLDKFLEFLIPDKEEK